jgi:hypothetical protein
MSSSNHGADPRRTPIIATAAAATRLARQRRVGAATVPAARFEKRFMRILAPRRRVLRRAAVDQPARAAAPGGSDEQAELDAQPSTPEMNRQETNRPVDRHRHTSPARPRAAHGAQALALDTPGATPSLSTSSGPALPVPGPPVHHRLIKRRSHGAFTPQVLASREKS